MTSSSPYIPKIASASSGRISWRTNRFVSNRGTSSMVLLLIPVLLGKQRFIWLLCPCNLSTTMSDNPHRQSHKARTSCARQAEGAWSFHLLLALHCANPDLHACHPAFTGRFLVVAQLKRPH